MPHITAQDGTRLYYEEAGHGTPVIFVHEYAGDYRTWEMQMRFFSRAHRCITYSQRGYPPSDVPSDAAKYSQDIARNDVLALANRVRYGRDARVRVTLGHPQRE
jgi:pimeloyl-ACP methyl ester carboxylesterase